MELPCFGEGPLGLLEFRGATFKCTKVLLNLWLSLPTVLIGFISSFHRNLNKVHKEKSWTFLSI